MDESRGASYAAVAGSSGRLGEHGNAETKVADGGLSAFVEVGAAGAERGFSLTCMGRVAEEARGARVV